MTSDSSQFTEEEKLCSRSDAVIEVAEPVPEPRGSFSSYFLVLGLQRLKARSLPSRRLVGDGAQNTNGRAARAELSSGREPCRMPAARALPVPPERDLESRGRIHRESTTQTKECKLRQKREDFPDKGQRFLQGQEPETLLSC